MRRWTVYAAIAVGALLLVAAVTMGHSTTKSVAPVTTAPAGTGTSVTSAGGSTTTTGTPGTATGATTTVPTANSAVTTSTVAAGPDTATPAAITGLPGGAVADWTAQYKLGGQPVVWSTSFHPLASSPNIKVNAAVFDQNRLTAALYNGNQLPGGTGWKNGDHVTGAALPSLVAAFNGGFLFKHIAGGYWTEGRTMKPLVNGQATLAVRKDGRLVLGIYGTDFTNDGSYLSFRQNLPPVVQNGQVVLSRYPGTYWGNNFHNVEEDYRSAICRRADGRLMYVVMGLVRIGTFADELAAMGCNLAMELDINGHWPQFAWYTGLGTSNRSGVLLDNRMWKPYRYLKGAEKDFIALFDPSTLPAGAVYSG